MILSRFLKPKWQTTDPEARNPASPALESPDPALRHTALERLKDLDQLQTLAREDTDAGVRAAALERYQFLLAGKAPDGPSLPDRLARLLEADPGLIDFLLRHAVEPELRLAALERTNAEATLVEIAVQDPQMDVRLAALGRVSEPESLDQIARQSRNRDKRIYRQARERLDALVAEKVRANHIERLCAEMENLRWDGESGLNAGRFPKLEQEWRDQELAAPMELRERYTEARARFLAERQASASRRTQRLELIASLDTLLERLRQAGESSHELDASVQYATHEAPAAWAYFGPVQDSEGRRLEQHFQQLVEAIQEQQRLLHRNQVRALHLREALRQADKLLQQVSEVHDTDLKQLQQHWESLERPESRPLATQLQGQFDGMLDKLRARIQRQVQERGQEWQELQELTTQLEAAIDNGQSQQAMTLHEQARQRLKRNIGLSRAQMSRIDERLQNCAGRIGELRDWRRWGAHQAREQLCTTAESLIGLELDPTEIAQRIQQARDAWKVLDHREGAASKGLWKRFNDACERAYIPCQAYFEAQSRERQQSLEKKIALCEQLEQFEAATDWLRVDWREADRLHRRAQEQWYKLGPVNRADRKSLDRRFQQILQRLDTRLGAERERERERRQQLIQQVQALVDSTDLRAAIETAKRAQAEWHPTVQAAPRQEQALWKAFRAACDAVFARRQAEQQAVDGERQGNLASKLALCAELEALIRIDDAQLAQARGRLQAIQQSWEAIGPAPKTEQRTLDQRFENVLRQFGQREQTMRRNRAQQTARHLRERARQCAQVEALLAGAPVDADVLAPFQQTWAALPALPAALLEPMQRRFAAACQALVGPGESARELQTTLEANLERKKTWCICMEIVAGVESPPAFASLRMEYQVARLSASLAGAASKSNVLYDPQQLQEQWRLTGALPADQEVELDDRFMNAVRAWQQQQREE
jgi:exonuclease SbcC